MSEMLTEAVRAYWAERMGVPVSPGTLVTAHRESLLNFAGVFLLRLDDALVVSVPGPMLTPVSQACEGRARDEVYEAHFWHLLFGAAVEEMVGPTWLGYVRAKDFVPVSSDGVRRLNEMDVGSLWTLADACDATDWQQSGIMFDGTVGFGFFDGDTLIAASMVTRRGNDMGEVGAITHPAWRGRGIGRSVVSAASAHGLEKYSILQYRGLEENPASVKLAIPLGYRRVAGSLVVRFAHPALA
ncbi:MAG: hypothetical protein FJX76_02165 [Armatimonadetes bacterium]|nr:hypothetical protein [Armatimonadota bacterium]